MQLQNVVNKIKSGKQEYQNATFFMANYIKLNLSTRAVLSEHVSELGELDGLRVLIDNELADGDAKIGMGNGPTSAIIKFY
jgi:hypothetical protein